MGKLHTKDALENHFKDRSFRLVHWLRIRLLLRRTSQESVNLERKSYLDCSLDTLCTREGIWKGDVLVANIEELETMDASEIHAKRHIAKESAKFPTPILLPTNLRHPKRNLLHDTLSRKHTKNQVKTRIQYNDLELCNIDNVSSNMNSFNLVRCCSFLKMTKPWSKWLSKVEVQQWDRCPEPTELLLIGCLTESTWNQRSKSADTKTQQQRSSSCPRDLVSWALLEQWLNIVRFLHETSPDFTNLEKKFHLEFSLGMR